MSAEEEVWRPIEAYVEYEVSSLGRVRKGEEILPQYKNDEGYLLVDLSWQGTPPQPARVDYLVLNAFVGPPPEPEPKRKPRAPKHRPESAQDEANRVLTRMFAMFEAGLSNDEVVQTMDDTWISDEAMALILGGKAKRNPTVN